MTTNNRLQVALIFTCSVIGLILAFSLRYAYITDELRTRVLHLLYTGLELLFWAFVGCTSGAVVGSALATVLSLPLQCVDKLE